MWRSLACLGATCRPSSATGTRSTGSIATGPETPSGTFLLAALSAREASDTAMRMVVSTIVRGHWNGTSGSGIRGNAIGRSRGEIAQQPGRFGQSRFRGATGPEVLKIRLCTNPQCQARCRFTASRFCRASARGTTGCVPNDRMLAFPPCLERNCQSFPPAGWTGKCRPSLSLRRKGLPLRAALRIVKSDNGR